MIMNYIVARQVWITMATKIYPAHAQIASPSKSDWYGPRNHRTKFHAFIIKCTMDSVLPAKPLHYMWETLQMRSREFYSGFKL